MEPETYVCRRPMCSRSSLAIQPVGSDLPAPCHSTTIADVPSASFHHLPRFTVSPFRSVSPRWRRDEQETPRLTTKSLDKGVDLGVPWAFVRRGEVDRFPGVPARKRVRSMTAEKHHDSCSLLDVGYYTLSGLVEMMCPMRPIG